MRIGEVLGLEPDDVDLDNGIVYVRRSNQNRKSQAEISRTLVGENVRLKQQLDAEKTEREAQSRRIAAIEAALVHRG
jgi:integrase